MARILLVPAGALVRVSGEAFVRLAPGTVLLGGTIAPSLSPAYDVTTVIVDLPYSIDDPQSFDRVPTYWLPTIRSLGVNVPVILIGNKIDARRSEIVPIMQECKEVETCVECSALLPLSISEVFFFAQNAVLHPTAPLYDTRQHTLKPLCVSALVRIFRLVDADKDGLRSPDELNDFQRLVVDAPLQAREVEGAREVVEQMTERAGVEDGGLNEEGWLALHTYFVQKGRSETTWKALRCFGYRKDLMLREDFLYPRFDIPSDCTAELSPRGYQWSTDIFEIFDQDRDGTLSPSELDTLFLTSPGNPWLSTAWPETTLTTSSPDGKRGVVTRRGSSPPPWTSALQITKPRRPSRRKGVPVERNVFLAYVLGAAGSGKTSLLRAFVGKGLEGEGEGEGEGGGVLKSAVAGGQAGRGKGKSMVYSVEEAGTERNSAPYESEVLRNKKKLEMADVLVFVYDSNETNSFWYLSNVRSSPILAAESSYSECRLPSRSNEASLRTSIHHIVRFAIHPLSALPYGPKSSASSLLGFPVTRTQLYLYAAPASWHAVCIMPQGCSLTWNERSLPLSPAKELILETETQRPKREQREGTGN
ncbi:ERMES complex Ca(2+)-binding regulatory GTPase gem1 [Rhodosporidiobolus nylandii]